MITRQQAGKEISRLPFTVTVNANDGPNQRAALRMGAEVPIRSTVFAEGKPTATSSYSYRSVGTSIDCGPISSVEGGRFRVALIIEDSSVYPDAPGAPEKVLDAPAFRSFRTSTGLMLRDGESTQFTAATDRINGEVVCVDVTLNVMK